MYVCSFKDGTHFKVAPTYVCMYVCTYRAYDNVQTLDVIWPIMPCDRSTLNLVGQYVWMKNGRCFYLRRKFLTKEREIRDNDKILNTSVGLHYVNPTETTSAN